MIESQAPTPPPATKNQKHRPQRVITELESESDKEDPQPLSSPPPVDFSYLSMNYELCLTSFLDNERVPSRFIITGLYQFSMRCHLAETVKLVEQHASKASKSVKWVKGEAELQHKGLHKANHPISDVNDEDGWREVENGVES